MYVNSPGGYRQTLPVDRISLMTFFLIPVDRISLISLMTFFLVSDEVSEFEVERWSTAHRGFGYVQFAVVEDASRAIELKNNSIDGGRKIVVKQAMHRASFEKHRPKETQAHLGVAVRTKNDNDISTAGIDKLGKHSNFQAKGVGTAVSNGLPEGHNSENRDVARLVMLEGSIIIVDYRNNFSFEQCLVLLCEIVCRICLKHNQIYCSRLSPC